MQFAFFAKQNVFLFFMAKALTELKRYLLEYLADTTILAKGLYLHDFERALKLMTCAQVESIHIDGFKNAKKNSNWYLVAMVSNQNCQKGVRNVSTPTKISQVREIVQN